jgi:hypothetical protein
MFFAAEIRFHTHERPSPDKRGGLNGSMQHLLEVLLQKSTGLISFATIDSNGTLPCLGSD